MITISQIRGGAGYMRRHLKFNDYVSEHESVEGVWVGEGAKRFGLEGEVVTAEAFEAFGQNKDPLSGEKLRPRASKVAYHDIVISAPKAVSIAAMPGGDERLLEAHDRAAMQALKDLESYAGFRDRKGAAYNSEDTVITGNVIAALFRHDTSRSLDPQVHTHCAHSNHNWSEVYEQHFALQPKVMMEQSEAWISKRYHQNLAQECQRLGYEVEWREKAFGLKGISREIEELYSERTRQKREFTERYQELFKEEPSKRRIEEFIKDTRKPAFVRFYKEYEEAFGKKPSRELAKNFVKDWRSDKMAKSSREDVLAGQLKRLNPIQKAELKHAVAIARAQSQTQKTISNEGPENAEALSMNDKVEPVHEAPKQEPEFASQRGLDAGEAKEKHDTVLELKIRKGAEQRPKVTKTRSQSGTKASKEALQKIKRGVQIARAFQQNRFPGGILINELSKSLRRRKQ